MTEENKIVNESQLDTKEVVKEEDTIENYILPKEELDAFLEKTIKEYEDGASVDRVTPEQFKRLYYALHYYYKDMLVVSIEEEDTPEEVLDKIGDILHKRKILILQHAPEDKTATLRELIGDIESNSVLNEALGYELLHLKGSLKLINNLERLAKSVKKDNNVDAEAEVKAPSIVTE